KRSPAVHRTLRFQLIAIVVATVASVLAMSQWLDTTFSERALERDLKERGLLVLSTVDSLWGRSDADTLAHKLAALVEGSRDVLAIDVYRVDSKGSEVALTTRSGEPPPVIDAEHIAQPPREGVLPPRVRGPRRPELARLPSAFQTR